MPCYKIIWPVVEALRYLVLFILILTQELFTTITIFCSVRSEELNIYCTLLVRLRHTATPSKCMSPQHGHLCH